MQKISWNDINDSDSSLESQSEQEVVKIVSNNDKNQLKKTTSSTLKNACDQYSLEKLQKHTSSTMWLYITNSYSQKADEIHQLLTKSNHFTQIIRLKTVGWNVETTSETGKQLIYEGLKGEGFYIKFIYSKKNQQRQFKQQQKLKNNKFQKKVTYIEKGKQLTIQKFNTFTEQTKNNELNQDQQVYSPRTKIQKQKSKWVEKNPASNSFNDFKSFEQPRANKNIRDFKSPKRYIEKANSSIDPKSSTHFKKIQETNICQTQQAKITRIDQKPSNQQSQKQIIKDVKVDKVIEKQEEKEQKQTSLQKKQQTKAEQANQSEEEEKQIKKKKNKKKRDGKGKKQQNKQESNNPFSYFSRF